jgi:hypothetical protein
MTTNDVFAKIDARMIEGVMLHDKMANYYDFLGLMGFKRMHEYHFLREAVEMRGVNRYYINHYNTLLSESTVNSPFSIPASWYGHVRRDMGASNKRSYIKTGIDTWCDWEKETKTLYEMRYCDLCDMNEIAAACKVKELVSCADMTLKCADRLALKLYSVDYDLPAVLLMQDDLHSEYDEKERELGVAIC